MTVTRDMKRSLAVLLTVHNRKDKTVMCLTHLFDQDMPNYVQMDVYMVDDGCTDGTIEAVKERFADVNIIRGDGSLYWNRGMWTAWDSATKQKKYDFFLWLNDDTFLIEGAIKQVLELSRSYNDEIIVVGATKASQSNQLTYGGRTKTGIPRCDGIPIEVKMFNGNIVLVPQAVYNVLGNLDYHYRHGKGDSDYAIRAVKAGIKMYQCGNVLGICDEHEHIDKWCNPEIPICQRWKAMHEPTGLMPLEWFHYEKQISILTALFHVMTAYVRCVLPNLWMGRIKRKA